MLTPFNIVFHKGKTPIARIIRLLTKSNYSHTAFCLDGLHLVQLDWLNPVTIKHLGYPMNDYDVYELTVELTEYEKIKVSRFIRERISTTYDWKFIFSRFFNILIGTPITNSEEKYNCDELIVDALRFIGVNLIEKDVKMTPDTLSKSKLLRQIN